MLTLRIVFVLGALLASGWADAQAFTFGHNAFSNGRVNLGSAALSLGGFLVGGLFYITALWLKRDVLALPTIVEFLCWLAVAYVGIIVANPGVLRWPLSDHLAILGTLGCVTFLAYRHGG